MEICEFVLILLFDCLSKLEKAIKNVTELNLSAFMLFPMINMDKDCIKQV